MELFTTLNKKIDDLTQDLDISQGKEFNYMKVLQHGISFGTQNQQDKKHRTYWNLPYPMFLLYLKAKKAKAKKDGKSSDPFELKEVLFRLGNKEFIDPVDGKWKSLYATSFLPYLPSVTTLAYDFLNVEGDIRFSKLKQKNFYHINDKVKKIIKDCYLVLKKIRSQKNIEASLLPYIESAFSLFLEDFMMYDFLLQNQPTKKVFFFPHYHTEGFMAAMKMNGVKAIELQHGLIDENDMYYIYPKRIDSIRKNALFSDKILVFGEYWKNLLLKGGEYSEDQIVLTGDYTASSKKIDTSNMVKENLIFIAAQTNMTEDYINYVTSLSKIVGENNPDWKIIIKLHPIEDRSEDYYTQLGDLKNVEIAWNDSNLFELFKRSKIQISIYSTTFFDAVGFKVMNLSLQNFSVYRDYARGMVSGGIALPLDFSENPVDIYDKNLDFLSKLENRDYYYQKVDLSLIEKVCKM